MGRTYIKKIEKDSEEWELYKDKDFDNNFCIEKTLKGKTYKYFYLNQENRNIFNIKNNEFCNFESINYYKLRDYQKESLQHILENRKVILNLPVRFGKSYLAVTTILNNKKNSILFVDPNMIEEFKNIFYEHGEENVFIYYKDKNNNIFKELNSSSCKIIITTEETFITRINNKQISKDELKNISLIENVIVDEYHNFTKMGNKLYKDFKYVAKHYFKNVDIFILMSATPTNENVFNVFYPISLLDKNFNVSDWIKKCFIYTKDHYGGHHYKLINKKCLDEIIKDSLYKWDKLDPFMSLQIRKVVIDQPLEIRSLINNESNIIKKQKINDDYRLRKDINSVNTPEKIKKAISILEEENNKNKKIVIFTYFKESESNLIEDLKKRNIRSEYINSDVTYKNRLRIIDDFQNKNLNVIILEIKTAVGITLDKADTGIIICDEYEVQKYYQALGRIISTDYYNLTFKYVYWIYDRNHNSKEKIEYKFDILESFGINYSPFLKGDISVFLESKSDLCFIDRLLASNKKYKLFNRNRLNFNPKFLSSIEKIGLNYIFVCDRDLIVKEMNLDKWNFTYITYNELFGVEDKFKNIEEILCFLNCYQSWQINLIRGCKENENINYKNFIYSFENIDHINDEENKKLLFNFLNEYVDKISCDCILDELYYYIKNAILSNPNKKWFFKETVNFIKSYFMSKIKDEFITDYSNIVIENLNKKINNQRIKNFKN